MAYNRADGVYFFQQDQVAYSSFLKSTPDTARSSSSYSSTCTCPHPESSSPSSSRYSYCTACRPDINASPSSQPFADFDMFEWHIRYQSCVRYFLDHAQYAGPVQAVAAFVNIQLPFQKTVNPVLSSTPGGGPLGAGPAREAAAAAAAAAAAGVQMPLGSMAGVSAAPAAQPIAYVTLVPYIRRLIVTACDFPGVLHGFFGDDWLAGIGPIRETERRNYLFAAKSENWLKVKAEYDMGEDQTVPFLRPLQNVEEKDIVTAETTWSEWLAMQDWMLGPRAPGNVGGGVPGCVNVKREQD